jgi:hypothetical protein
MKKLLLLMTVMFSLSVCGQTVKKAYAFYRVQSPGNIPVDDDGKPIGGADTVRFIYIECSGNVQPVITRADYRGRMYAISTLPVENLPVMVGKAKGSERQITIKPAKGNSLWLVELSPEDRRSPYRSKITLQGKRFTVTVSQEVELEPEIRG